jgi:hypothetical protein
MAVHHFQLSAKVPFQAGGSEDQSSVIFEPGLIAVLRIHLFPDLKKQFAESSGDNLRL